MDGFGIQGVQPHLVVVGWLADFKVRKCQTSFIMIGREGGGSKQNMKINILGRLGNLVPYMYTCKKVKFI